MVKKQPKTKDAACLSNYDNIFPLKSLFCPAITSISVRSIIRFQINFSIQYVYSLKVLVFHFLGLFLLLGKEDWGNTLEYAMTLGKMCLIGTTTWNYVKWWVVIIVLPTTHSLHFTLQPCYLQDIMKRSLLVKPF